MDCHFIKRVTRISMQAWNIPFYNTTISDLLEDPPRKNVTCVTCYFYMWLPHRPYGFKVNRTQRKWFRFSGVCMAKWYYITVCMWFVRCSHSWDIQHSKEYFVFQRALLFSSLQIWKLGEQDFSPYLVSVFFSPYLLSASLYPRLSRPIPLSRLQCAITPWHLVFQSSERQIIKK